MNLMVLNTNLEAIAIIDDRESFIWTDRYNEYGDFELYTPANSDIFKYIIEDYYIVSSESEHCMIIENSRIKYDVETGSHIIAIGRSLESILDRRIVWSQTTINGSLQEGIRKLLNDAIISPSNSERKINNFVFERSTDSAITSLTLNAQFTGDNLYDVISSICKVFNIGFKITLSETGKFVFKLYAGKDRSYDQTTLPYVIFSPRFENLINSNYIKNKQRLKTVTLVGGEGEGSDRTYAIYKATNDNGLNRRELFTDARDISKDVDVDVVLTDAEYEELLIARGIEEIANYKEMASFEGQTETTIMFKYGEDFFMGDIVQIENEYGHNSKARIAELVTSENNNETLRYPTFELIT